jgi:predicted adenine nucleotide alpha hydrolase (AANH) superfamily ATPase
MANLKLFGSEVEQIISKVVVETIKPKEKRVTLKKAIIRIDKGNYSTETEHNGVEYPNGTEYIGVTFEGHQEGSSCTYLTEEDVQIQVQSLKDYYGDKYRIEVIDERSLNDRFNPLLNKWKTFIVNLCKEKGQEIDKIWFAKSTPLDCEIAIRLAGHRCWNACIDFRFEKGRLKAYDSHFGGGTSFIEVSTALNPNAEQEKVIELMERVFNKECSNSSWEDNHSQDNLHRVININESGWII